MRRGNLAGTALIAVMCAAASFGQPTSEKVSRIRALYAATNARIEAGITGDRTLGLHYAAWTVGGDRDGQQWPAVGTMRRADEYYFDGQAGTDGDGKVRDPKKSIRKIASTYAGAADLRSASEYYFDDGGTLVFAFSTELDDDGKTVERRLYFFRNLLIRSVIDDRSVDTAFPKDHLRRASEAQAEAKRLQARFALIFAE